MGKSTSSVCESGDVIGSFKHAISEQLLASVCQARENFEIYNMQYYMNAKNWKCKLSILSTTRKNWKEILFHLRFTTRLSWRNSNMNDECQQFSNCISHNRGAFLANVIFKSWHNPKICCHQKCGANRGAITLKFLQGRCRWNCACNTPLCNSTSLHLHIIHCINILIRSQDYVWPIMPVCPNIEYSKGFHISKTLNLVGCKNS